MSVKQRKPRTRVHDTLQQTENNALFTFGFVFYVSMPYAIWSRAITWCTQSVDTQTGVLLLPGPRYMTHVSRRNIDTFDRRKLVQGSVLLQMLTDIKHALWVQMRLFGEIRSSTVKPLLVHHRTGLSGGRYGNVFVCHRNNFRLRE